MTRRTAVSRSTVPAAGARAVLASGLLLGLAMIAGMAVERSHMLAANFEVYYLAADAAVSGGDVYDVAPDRFPHFYYLYPPITVVQFVPFLAVDLWTAFALHTLLEVAIGVGLATVIVRWIERYRPLRTFDRVLVAGFVVGSIHTVPSLFYGQVNLRMAALVGVGVYLLERGSGPSIGEGDSTPAPVGSDRSLAGAALAGAALLKVFPAAIGLWLLRNRAWSAVGAALATGLGGLVAGVLIFGRDATRTYFLEALLPRTDDAAFVGGLDPTATYVTVRRPLSILLPDLDPTFLSMLAAVVLLAPLAFVYTRIETPIDRLVAAHATLLAIFVFFPSYPLYYVLTFGTLVPTLYLVADRPARRLLVAGALLANLVIFLEHVDRAVEALPSTIGGPLSAVGTPLLTFWTPMLVGCLCMLAGCVVHRYRRGRRSSAR